MVLHLFAALYVSTEAVGTYIRHSLVLSNALTFDNVGGVVGSHIIDVNPVQPLKAEAPMLVTPLGIVTDVRSVQSLKTLALMLFTPLGIVTDVRSVQFWKA